MMIHESFSSNLVEQDGELTFVEEDIIFSLVANVGAEVFAHAAMPVRTVLLIELLLDMLGHQELGFEVIDCIFSLSDQRGTSRMA